MNKTIGVQLLAYALLLAGLSYLVHHLAPKLAETTLITGLVGSPLCIIWGVRAIAGNRGKSLVLLTLLPVCFMMLSQTVLTWGGDTGEAPERQKAAAVISVLFVLSLAMLMRVAYAGVVFEGQPAAATKDTGKTPQGASGAGKTGSGR